MAQIQYCAPNVTKGLDIENHFSCFNANELREIARAFNKYCKDESPSSHINEKMCSSRQSIVNIDRKSKRELWKDIYDKMELICKYEWCWLDSGFIDKIEDEAMRKKVAFFTFKPKMTPERYSWLSTKDINNVLNQYEKARKDFLFLGAQPADYLQVEKRIDTRKFVEYSYIGIIFNLDPHNKPGSHWVALIVDNKRKTIEYFDSTGNRPNKYIRKYIKYLIRQPQLKRYEVLVNKRVHQKLNSECGVYAINFILEKLRGKSFEQITNKIVDDGQMNKMRGKIFRPFRI
jgi:hypothetical protein